MAGTSSKRVIVELLADTRQALAGIQGAGDAVRNFGNRSKAAANESAQAWQQAASSFAAVGRSIQVASAALAAGLTLSVKSTIDFGRSMANVNSIAQESAQQFAQTRREVLKMATDLGTTQGPQQLADALYDINSASFTGADGLKVLAESARGADAGITTAKISADGLTTELRAFGLEAKDASTTMDLMFQTVKYGKLTFDDLAQNIGKVATFAHAAGVSSEELHAGIAQLTARGLSAEESMVALRGAIKAFVDPSKDQLKILDKYGIAYGKAAFESKGLIGVLQEINTATGGNQQEIAQVLGEIRGLNAALGIIGDDGGQAYIDLLDKMVNRGGATTEALAQQQKSIGAQLGILRAQAEVAAIALGDALAPSLQKIGELAGRVISWFNGLSDSTKALIAKSLAVAAAVGTVAGTLLAMAPAIAAVPWAAVGGFLASWAPPVAAVIAAITGLGLAWRNNLGNIQEHTKNLLTFIQGQWVRVVDYFRDPLDQVLTFFRATWIEIQELAADAWVLIGPAVRAGLRYVGDAFQEYGKIFSAYWAAAWELVSGTVEVAWEVIKTAVRVGLESVRTILEVLTALLAGDFSLAWQRAKDGAVRIWSQLQSGVSGITSEIYEFLSSFGDKLKALGAQLVNSFAAGIRSQIQHVQEAWREMVAVSQGEIAQLRPAAQFAFGDLRNTTGAVSGSLAGAARTIAGQIPKGGTTAATTPKDHTALFSGAGTGGEVDLGLEVVRKAREWVGKSFNPGSPAQCAIFVREVTSSAGIQIGTSKNPIDAAATKGLPQGPGYANSLFGPDVGELIKNPSSLKPGDLVGFKNTYGNFPDGTITHTGIYTDKNTVIHRPTKDAPVEEKPLSSFGDTFAGGIRPFGLGGDELKAYEQLLKESEDRHKESLQRKKEAEREYQQFVKSLDGDKAAQEAAKMGQQAAEDEARFQEKVAKLAEFASQSTQIGAEMAAQADQEHQRQIDNRLQMFDLEIELGRQTLDQKILFMEELLLNEEFTTQRRLELEVELQSNKRQLEQDQLANTQAVTQSLEGSFQSFLQNTITGQQKWGDSFKQLWQSVSKSIIAEITKMIVKALALKKIFGGLFGFLGFHDGGVVGGDAGGSLGGGLGGLLGFHKGGLVPVPSFHSGGLVGGSLRPDEVLAKLQVGEIVLSRDTVRTLGSNNQGRSTPMEFHAHFGSVNNYGPDTMEAYSQRMAWGMRSAVMGG